MASSSIPRPAFDVMFAELNRLVGLSREEWDAHLPGFKVLDAGAKHILQEAGKPVTHSFFIATGLVRFYYLTSGGRELNKGFYGERQMVGCLSGIILNEPARFAIETLEPCTLVQMPVRRPAPGLERDNGWDRFFNHCCRQMLVRNERREAELLTMSSRERFIRFCTNFPNYLERIPQYHIASYLGITPVALSRYKKQWLGEPR